MLASISLGQGRTHCPGLAADERGVVMGRYLALFFMDLPRTISFFRSFSREQNLDELLPSLEILQTKNEKGGQEIMVRFEAAGSHLADRAAQAARMHMGRVFSGTEVHFVPYRDRQSPMGYDVSDSKEIATDESVLALYTKAGEDRRTFGRQLHLRDLIFSLSPRPLSEGEKEREQNDVLVVTCPYGLSDQVCRYLWQRQIAATITRAKSGEKSLFTKRSKNMMLIRCENVPRHVAGLLRKTPGIDIFVPVQPNLFVQWGHRHPIALESCGQLFEPEETVLFHASPQKPEKLIVEENSADIRDLVEVHLDAQSPEDAPLEPLDTEPVHALQVEVKLGPLPHGSAATHALLIPMERLSWFTKLVYLMPAALLRSYEAVIAQPYIIVVNRRGVHGIPFGNAMTETYPQLFVPVGMQLLPRVDYDLIRDHFNIRPDKYAYFFPEGEEPFCIASDAFEPLSRSIVAFGQAQINIVEVETQKMMVSAPVGSVRHRRQGMFSLWRGASLRGTDPKLSIPEWGAPQPNALPAASEDLSKRHSRADRYSDGDPAASTKEAGFDESASAVAQPSGPEPSGPEPSGPEPSGPEPSGPEPSGADPDVSETKP